jgi:hypothetical protein
MRSGRYARARMEAAISCKFHCNRLDDGFTLLMERIQPGQAPVSEFAPDWELPPYGDEEILAHLE